jgi:hypothetical protein
MRHLPGVCMKGVGCAPFLSIEHKTRSDDAMVKVALHQAACSSYGWLVERQRLQRVGNSDYVNQPNMRHYGNEKREYNYGSYLRLLTPTPIKQHFQNFRLFPHPSLFLHPSNYQHHYHHFHSTDFACSTVSSA